MVFNLLSVYANEDINPKGKVSGVVIGELMTDGVMGAMVLVLKQQEGWYFDLLYLQVLIAAWNSMIDRINDAFSDHSPLRVQCGCGEAFGSTKEFTLHREDCMVGKPIGG